MFHNFLQKYNNLPKQGKAAIWYAICGFIIKGLTLITTPIFTRLLTTSQYGIFSVYATWQHIITIFATLNLASGVYVRGLIKFENDSERFTASIQSLFLVVFSFVVLIYLGLIDFWDSIFDLPRQYMFALFAGILLQASFHFWSARQRVNFEYKRLVLFTLANAIVSPALGITAVILFEDKVTARVYAGLLSKIIIFGWLLLQMVFVNTGIELTKYWKYALSYNLPLVPHYLSQIILNQSDRIMIKAITGASNAGIYSLAYSAALILTIVNNAIINSYSPWLYRNLKNKNYYGIRKISMNLLIGIGFVNIFLIAFAPEAVAILAPQAYYKAIWVIPPVTMSVFFMFMYNLFSQFEFYYEKTKYIMAASVGAAVLNIILNYFFIHLFGFLAAGYTTLACYIAYSVFHYVVMNSIVAKEIPEYRIYEPKTIVRLSFLFVAVGTLFLATYAYPLYRYSLIIIIIVVSYVNRSVLRKLLNEVLEIRQKK